MSLLRIALGIIFCVNIRLNNAGRGSGVVRRRMPRSVQHFHVTELIERNAAPVVRRSRRPQAGFAFSAVLTAKNPELPFPVPSQPVRTKQAVAIVVNGRDWTPAFDGRAYNPVNIGQQANSARSRSATHTFRLLRTGKSQGFSRL
jgi:hypothetical protein